jgi:hypothetical protein
VVVLLFELREYRATFFSQMANSAKSCCRLKTVFTPSIEMDVTPAAPVKSADSICSTICLAKTNLLAFVFGTASPYLIYSQNCPAWQSENR